MVLDEVDELDVEVSILSALEEVPSEAELRTGVDGVVLEYRGRRATFLPVMWERLGDLATFMLELRRKAGVPSDADLREIRLWRYTVERYVEANP